MASGVSGLLVHTSPQTSPDFPMEQHGACTSRPQTPQVPPVRIPRVPLDRPDTPWAGRMLSGRAVSLSSRDFRAHDGLPSKAQASLTARFAQPPPLRERFEGCSFFAQPSPSRASMRRSSCLLPLAQGGLSKATPVSTWRELDVAQGELVHSVSLPTLGKRHASPVGMPPTTAKERAMHGCTSQASAVSAAEASLVSARCRAASATPHGSAHIRAAATVANVGQPGGLARAPTASAVHSIAGKSSASQEDRSPSELDRAEGSTGTGGALKPETDRDTEASCRSFRRRCRRLHADARRHRQSSGIACPSSSDICTNLKWHASVVLPPTPPKLVTPPSPTDPCPMLCL
mmetsp:Transcript_116460/g.364048  ORF Transcript_116460/g.364048 Transcript_116460/m.364048 type:complete len:346 (+) Transcript_116460:1-1038(+)